MKTKKLSHQILGLLVVLTLGSCSSKAQKSASKAQPNILWIMCDDHTANTISSYKMRFADMMPTPNIDRLADEGALLNNCFVTNSICTPSRATIMTGQYGHVNGVHTLWQDLREEDETVATLLQKNGYETAIIGKWHLHTEPQGFDYFSVLPGQGAYFNPIFKEKGTKWTHKKEGKKYKGYVTDVITDNSLTWLQNRKEEKPFFLMLHHKAPHGLWEYAPRHEHLFDSLSIPAPESLFEDKSHRSEGSREFGRDLLGLSGRMYEGKRGKDYPTGKLNTEGMTDEEKISNAYQKYMKDYLRVVAAIDENVGKVLDYLETSGLAENTVVAYTSDQGMFLGEHSYYDKRWMYDASLKMPFLIRKPGEIKPGTQVDAMVTNLDFPELILDYAGVAIPENMQGRSFRPLLAGNPTPKDWRTSMYYQYWMQFEPSAVPAHLGVRTEDYKLIFFYGHGLGLEGTTDSWQTPVTWELYDLKKDPKELNNIYGKEGLELVTKALKDEILVLQERYSLEVSKYPALKERMEKHWND